jgi:Ca2+-binding RTX toxin-like protein
VIIGDNANIFRLVGINGISQGQFLNFTYDNYSDTLKIIPRAVELLDYTLGGNPADLGNDDLIRGEAGDDVIHGMTGNDVIFGDGQDDDIYGGVGSDRLYGGTGEDGILGDDGKIYTSRNGLTETLNGITQINAETNISLPGPFTSAWVYITGRLHKTVDLAAGDKGGNDIIYGGLGDDYLHGGAGDDAISGAEAQAAFYNSNLQTNTNPLNYDPITRKFAAYDANNPMKRINGFLLNFDAVENGNKVNDGKDNIFGDLGHDWLVGGTQNDRLFGGMGDDLMNADDNHDTAGGLNNIPDAPEFADADFVFGGDGLDVLIGNTGGDRLFDWLGEFNSFWVPFSPYGNPTVVRSPSPLIQQLILDLGKSSGADQTVSEPNGELGLITPQDPQWQNQHGSPRDPQAGNTQARRDTQGAPEDDRNTALTLFPKGKKTK